MRVLIVNAYSTLNRGDASILDGLVGSLRANGSHWITVAAQSLPGEEARCRALGADDTVPMLVDGFAAPRGVRRTYPTMALWVGWSIVRAVVLAMAGRHKALAAIQAYKDADVVISTGGGYIGGGRPGANLLTLFPIAFARICGKRVLVAPITVKPMSKTVSVMVAAGLRGATVLGREPATVCRLEDLGIKARLASDLAFHSARLASRPESSIRSIMAQNGLVVALAPRAFGSDHDAFADRDRIEAETLRAMSELIKKRNGRLLLISQATVPGLENDQAVVQRFADRSDADVRRATVVLTPAETIELAADQLRRADVLLAYRMHAAIIGLFVGTPSLVIGYESKVRDVFQLLGLQDWVIDPRKMPSGEELANRLADLAAGSHRAQMEHATAIAQRFLGPFDEALRRFLAG